MSEFFNDIVDRAMEILDEHSPSKVFELIGKYVPVGFVNGVVGQKKKTLNAVGTFMEDTVNVARNALGNIAGAISPQHALLAGAGASGTVIQNFSYNQTNNSPKSLSRLEIYRQSKNLLKLKGGN